ncbi:MAG: NAD(P)H-hydrate dehydratase [Cellvibrionaceae bacterium]
MPHSDADLPTQLYSADQCRELDRIAIEQAGIPGIVLMKRAGRAAYQTLLAHWPNPSHIEVFCGSGNNAGDGYIVAALAAQKNVAVRVIQVGDPAKLGGDAARAHQFACQAQVEMVRYSTNITVESGVAVDAMLGTGARGAPRGDYAHAIDTINASGLPVLAIDLPSGLDADTGHAPGSCIRAAATVTFIGVKRGLLTGRAPAVVGTLCFDDLGVPDWVYAQIATATVCRLNLPAMRGLLAPRPVDAHKGMFGHVLVVGGDHGMGGAALMAAEAAARVGSGLVSVGTRGEHCTGFLARRPELMVHDVDSAEALAPLLSRANVVVLGPGLGQSDWSRALLKAVLASELPMVIDADGLNLISEEGPSFLACSKYVLTPHPGEAGRLLGCTTADIQADRFTAVAALRARFGGVVILKGAGSLIASGVGEDQDLALAKVGNPGMASGGMGDILSGVLGGLVAQGLSLGDAARLGVTLHGKAADLAAEDGGERGLLATDLLPHLRNLANGP